MKKINILLTLALTFFAFSFATAQQWQTPVIDGYGKIKYFKDAAVQPDKAADYKILYHITSDKTKEGVNAALWHIARQINLFGVAGVPKSNVQIVAVISGDATPLVLSASAYQKKHGKSNPNLDLIKKLTEYGVKIEICGQAAAEHNIDVYSELNPDIILTLSSLIDVPHYQMQGYSVMF